MDYQQKYFGISRCLGKINNPDFNYPEFGVIEQDAGVNRFIMSVGQWIERTKATGMIVKAGRKRAEENYDYNKLVRQLVEWLEGFM